MAATALVGPATARHASHIRHHVSDRRCAREDEQTAIEVAAVQQELMVAALTCNSVPEFNAFQNGYLKDLRVSDRRLMTMFHRLYGRHGEAEYHAFKTRLANDDSMRSIHDNAAYCAETKQVFAAAQAVQRPKLADFVAGVDMHDSGPVESCAMMEAAEHPVPSIVPTPNPLRLAALEAPTAAASTPLNTAAPQSAVAAVPSAAVPGAAAPGSAIPGTTPSGAAVPATAVQPATAPAAPAATAEATKPDGKKKSGGLFSSIFN